MAATLKTLTAEKFQEINTNKKFRNECSNAHGCADQYHNHKHYATCSYPISYIITKEQILQAQKVRSEQKAETLKKYNSKEFDNVLVLVTMGMDFDRKTIERENQTRTENYRKSDIENFRIRGDFKTAKGKFFVEFMTNVNGYLYCDFALEYKGKDKVYNYGRIERQITSTYYTKENILKLINKTFDANFKSIYLDQFDIGTDDFCSRSIQDTNL